MATLTAGALTVHCQACGQGHDVPVRLRQVGTPTATQVVFAAIVDDEDEQQLSDWASTHYGPFTTGQP